jgi:hypothetical protein
MRPGLLPDNLLERLAIRLNLGPVPDGHAMFGMPMSRVTIAGVRMGVFERLARGPAATDGSRPRCAAATPICRQP